MERSPYAITQGKILEGHIFTDGAIGRDYAKNIEQQLASMGQGVNKIVHHIRSGGGNVYGGYEGYLALKKTGLPIKTIIEGQAQSMATFIALAGDEVEMMDPGIWMIHNPYFPDGVSGDADELLKASSELKLIEDAMANEYAKKTGRSIEEIKGMMKKETRLNPRQAKDMGFVDNVISASGQVIASEETFLNKLEDTIMKLFGNRQAVATGPTAKDYALKAGGTISINGDAVTQGLQAVINGAPAEGSYELADGTLVMCTQGVISQVTPPVMPTQQTQQTANPQQTMQQQLAEVQKKLAAMEAEKVAAEAAKAAEAEKAKAAEAEKARLAAEETATKLAAAEARVKELEAQPIGNQAPARQAVASYRFPSGGPDAASVEATKKFLFENGFAYLTQYPNSPMYNYQPGPSAASVLETSFSYTWPGILTTEIFYKPQLTAPSLADIFTVDQGIKDRKRYNLVDKLDKILKPYGGCARSFTGTVNIQDTIVQTKEFQVGLEWCKDDFTDQLTGVYNVLASEWLKTGNRSFDPTGTPIFTVIDKLASEALARDVFRRVSFAAGNSSDDDYNQIDGLWDRLIDSSGQSNYCVVRANSPVTGGTALGTGTLAAGIALTNLELVYAKSKQVLKNMPNKVFWVTRSIWDNLYNSYIGSGAVTEQQFENLVKGLQTLTYKGIPVKPVDLWDDFLTESDNPLFATTRHLILLTTRENHILGVENGSDLNKLEGWYERKDRKFYMEGDMKFGYNYLHCDLSTIAY